MFGLNEPNTFWLNVINIFLGVVALICCMIVGTRVVRELLEHIRMRKSALVKFDDHVLHVSELGITMTDGGERLEKKSSLAVSDKGLTRIPHTDDHDEANIKSSDS